MTNILRIDRISCTFTKRQKVDRIEQIGFSHPVLPEKAIQFGRKIQVLPAPGFYSSVWIYASVSYDSLSLLFPANLDINHDLYASGI